MRNVGEFVAGRPVFYVSSTWTVREVARYMSDMKIGAVPVLEGEKLSGIFSERDLMSRVVVPGKDPNQIRVAEVMTRHVVTAAPEDSPGVCLRKMQQAKCRHIPVLENHRLLGTLSLRELMQTDLAEKVVEIRAMSDYIRQ